MASPPRFLDQMREVLRLKPRSFRTEETYGSWVKRCILLHEKRHPKDMGAAEIRAFLSYLATHEQVAASTQNSALNALLFLYRSVLKQSCPQREDIERAKRPRWVPTVLSRTEVQAILSSRSGLEHLMVSLLYGSGLRPPLCAGDPAPLPSTGPATWRPKLVRLPLPRRHAGDTADDGE